MTAVGETASLNWNAYAVAGWLSSVAHHKQAQLPC